MAGGPTEFSYCNIQLYKAESLGSGSYGGVCKAKCDGLLCAAKIMHPTLFDMRDPGAVSYIRKFQEECHLLSLAKHPNVVQYLGTHYDPDTRLPVLLMELCDESLTAFLERSPGPLSYHVQVNICHDISLALVYLHSNGLIHRDLTGNNVLIMTGSRAKITDFGMSKLASVNPRMTALTLCPGNILYMSPEALDEAKSYTAKLDIFSFGVIVIQVLTRQFPNPIDRFRMVYVAEYDEILRKEVPETERRQTHLKIISDTHPLKPLVLQCLKRKENERPSALEISERLSELKQHSLYTESMDQSDCTKCKKYQAQIVELKRIVEKQVQEQTCVTDSKERQGYTQERNERHQLKEQVQLTGLEQSLQQKDKTIVDLQQSISAYEIQIQQLEQQEPSDSDKPYSQQAHLMTMSTNPKKTKKMRWKKGKNAPVAMHRGAAVVHGNTVCFRPGISHKVYSFQNIIGGCWWTLFPDNPNKGFDLAVINGLLTSVGGANIDPTNTLLSLRGEGERKEWSEIFPPMPTPRRSAACISTEQALVVAGGYVHVSSAVRAVDSVEVMNTNTTQWTSVCPLPKRCLSLSATICGDKLYLGGGATHNIACLPSKSVFSCSLSDLLQSMLSRPTTKEALHPSHRIWREIKSLPVTHSTIVSFGGHVLAIGGSNDSGKPTSDIYTYDSHNDSWSVTSQMKNRRSNCFAVTLLEEHLIVVGGYTNKKHATTDSVEVCQ